eukprot:g9435.t1
MIKFEIILGSLGDSQIAALGHRNGRYSSLRVSLKMKAGASQAPRPVRERITEPQVPLSDLRRDLPNCDNRAFEYLL